MPHHSTSLGPRGEKPLLERLSSQLVPELKRYLTQHRAAVAALVEDGSLDAGIVTSHRYSKVYDGLLSSLFSAAETAMLKEKTWVPLSLAAVGSYGREVLGPFSDLDVRLLCTKNSAKARPAAEALLYPLWDAGLNIGHQVVTVDEMIDLARKDLPTATCLLDWRPLAGDNDIGQRMLDRAFQGVFGPGGIGQFIARLEQGAAERHQRFGGSVFLLEPDVKNGEGGLRDLDVALWAARARWRVRDLGELVRAGVLVGREWAEIEHSRTMLMRVRNLLHLEAGRRAERLSFEQQERLAARLGYGTGGIAVERFMSEYYRHARSLARARESILARAQPPPRRPPRETSIGRGLKLTRDARDAVSLVDPAALWQDPALALRIYDEAVRRNLPVYPFARHALARAASSEEFCEALRQSREAAELFVKLACVVQRTHLKNGSVLQDLHDVGLLVAMIPEFAPVVGRVHHDIYHVYTVDVHSVAALDQLRALSRGDLAAEHPLACRLAAELPRPNVVFFATLLHDVGKDLGGKNHADRGAEMTRDILGRLGFSEPDIFEAQHLVRKHLRMYHVASRRDLDDPKTLEEFCADVHGLEGLRELYLLTLSDVTTTSPGSMTSWKRRTLDELYVAAERFLSEGGAGPEEARVESVKALVRKQRPAHVEAAFLEHFLSALPERYLYANEPAALIQQADFAARAEKEVASIGVLTTTEPYVELCVVADDRPGLLAMITATFSHAKLKVLGAQVYSWVGSDGRRRSLDMFWVRSGQQASATVKLVPRLESELRRLMAGEIDAVELVTGSRQQPAWTLRHTPPVETKVNVDNRGASNHTIIEVTTRDRRGLLFWLASTLQQSGLSIDLAKVNTEGERVADVFYVVDERGGKVTDEALIEELKARISAAIARMESGGQA